MQAPQTSTGRVSHLDIGDILQAGIRLCSKLERRRTSSLRVLKEAIRDVTQTLENRLVAARLHLRLATSLPSLRTTSAASPPRRNTLQTGWQGCTQVVRKECKKAADETHSRLIAASTTTALCSCCSNGCLLDMQTCLYAPSIPCETSQHTVNTRNSTGTSSSRRRREKHSLGHGLELQVVARWVLEKHCPLLARLPWEAQVRLN